MLFAYTYVHHSIEKMQRFVNFIFYQVWCRAPKTGPYSLNLFDAHPPLKQILVAFAYDHRKEGDLFSSRIQAIYDKFAKLSRSDISKIKRWYQSNNNIKYVCCNDPLSQIARYCDIEKSYPQLNSLLGDFFKNLYADDLLCLQALREKIGKVDDHYRAFMNVNNVGKCPFCGLSDMLGPSHSRREAYDHYLPKALYPFNSMNFHNLVPACHHCNSSYKTRKDPSFVPKDPAGNSKRRKAFYPYTTDGHSITITIDLNNSNIDNLAPADIQLAFGPAVVHEEIETWKEVYGIEERYRGKIMDCDGKAWLTEVLDEWRWKDNSDGAEGRAPEEYLRVLAHHANRSPYTGSNFLKLAFLEGCQRARIF